MLCVRAVLRAKGKVLLPIRVTWAAVYSESGIEVSINGGWSDYLQFEMQISPEGYVLKNEAQGSFGMELKQSVGFMFATGRARFSGSLITKDPGKPLEIVFPDGNVESSRG